jgi:hypothetical protein
MIIPWQFDLHLPVESVPITITVYEFNFIFSFGSIVVMTIWYTVVEFITTFAISAYHHYSCEFEFRSGEVYLIQNYVIKFVSDLRQVAGFLRVLEFPQPIKLTVMI